MPLALFTFYLGTTSHSVAQAGLGLAVVRAGLEPGVAVSQLLTYLG